MSEDPTPKHEFLKRGEVIAWLTSPTIKLSVELVRKWLSNDTIGAIKWPGASYAHYSRTQIQRDILRQQATSAEGSAPAGFPPRDRSRPNL